MGTFSKNKREQLQPGAEKHQRRRQKQENYELTLFVASTHMWQMIGMIDKLIFHFIDIVTKFRILFGSRDQKCASRIFAGK